MRVIQFLIRYLDDPLKNNGVSHHVEKLYIETVFTHINVYNDTSDLPQISDCQGMSFQHGV